MDGGDLLTSCMSDPLYCRRTHGATWLVRDTCDASKHAHYKNQDIYMHDFARFVFKEQNDYV